MEYFINIEYTNQFQFLSHIIMIAKIIVNKINKIYLSLDFILAIVGFIWSDNTVKAWFQTDGED